MKIYLSGKITGDSNYRGKFQQAADRFPYMIVLNPAILPSGLSYSQYMDIYLAMVRAADRVIALPDWEDSPGARAEVAYALSLGLPVIKLKNKIISAENVFQCVEGQSLEHSGLTCEWWQDVNGDWRTSCGSTCADDPTGRMGFCPGCGGRIVFEDGCGGPGKACGIPGCPECGATGGE